MSWDAMRRTRGDGSSAIWESLLVMMKLRKIEIERTKQNKAEDKAETGAAINFSLERSEKSPVKLCKRDEAHMGKKVRL